jgi:hypothetical protein
VIFVTPLARRLLFPDCVKCKFGEGFLQYTIEARQLTSESTQRRHADDRSQHTVVLANDANEAIQQYVRERQAELVSFTRPGRGDESIATVKKADGVFLVRVYSA